MTEDLIDRLVALRLRLARLEERIAEAERREAERSAVVAHMRKHRTQQYLRHKLGRKT